MTRQERRREAERSIMPILEGITYGKLVSHAVESLLAIQDETWAAAFRAGYDRGKSDERDAKAIDDSLAEDDGSGLRGQFGGHRE